MATYYIDTASSGGDGTTTDLSGSHAAFATIAAAQAALTGDQSDNSLLFKRDGIWHEKFVLGMNGTAGHPFTIGAYGSGANPMIDLSVQKTDWTLDSGSIWKRTGTGEVGGQTKQVFQDNVRLKKVATKAAMVAGSFCQAEAPTLYVWLTDSSNPNTNHTVEHPIYNNAIDFNGKSYIDVSYIDGKRSCNGVFNFREVAGAHHINVSYCNASQSGFRGFDGGGTGTKYDITLSHVVAHDCQSEGIWMGIGYNFTISDFEIYDGHKDAANGYTNGDLNMIIADSVSNTLVTRGYIHDCYDQAMFGLEWETGYSNPTGVIVERCHFVDNQVHAANAGNVWLAGGDSTCEFRYNVVEVKSSSSGTYKSNAVALSNATGGSAAGIKLYNNTIIQELATKWAVYIANTAYGTLKNNILRNTGDNTLISEGTNATSSTESNNLYYGTSGSYFYGMHAGVEKTTFAAWVTASGDTDSKNSDPLLVSSSDFHLQSGSPCIDAGVDVSLTEDYEGHSIVGNPDIGAYEFVALLAQEGFRFRNDDGDEASATWAGAENAGITAPVNQNMRLRFIINATGDPGAKSFQLEYKKSTDSDWAKVI